MLWHQNNDGSQRWSWDWYPLTQLDFRMKHHQRGGRDAPKDIDFIVVVRSRSDAGPTFRECSVHVEVHRCCCRWMFKFFRVNVIKRRLHESV